ncbi:fungal-specific transcription factor domain-containing protein [Camillea tinctor]|nr:fungal-specific transcription factor domain-containing protein [Camillea tinctor]
MSEEYDSKTLHSPGTNPVQVGSTRPRPPPNRRRDKPQLSCNLCRRRKLKCNRQLPCSTCTKRGVQSSCTYASVAGPSSPIGHSGTPASSNSIQDRLKRLEDLVVSLVHQDRDTSVEAGQIARATSIAAASRVPSDALNTPPASTVNDDTVPAQPELGTLRLSDTETKYQDQSHWTSVLDAIAELKEDVGERGQIRPPTSNPDTFNPNSHIILLYKVKDASREEILSSIPPRSAADRLIAHYFEALKLASCLIHSGEFLKQYNAFWEDPQNTPIIWVGLLFAILAIAAQFEFNNAEASSSELKDEYLPFSGSVTLRPVVHEYRERVVQCLHLGRYTRGGPFVLETLIHYVGIEFALRKDASSDVWLALGITVQLAVRMGYHRDPSHFKRISPFDGEMRRRVWAMLYHMDLGISGQMGAPRLIRDSIVDTAEPRSLLDSDFNADTVVLPPSRPETEATPALVVLAKIRMVSVYGVVSDLINSTKPFPYSRVMEVDNMLKEALEKVPEYCRVRPISDCIMDPASIIIQRIYIQTTYHKAQIVLHLRYLTASRDDDRYIYSRRATLEAAIAILKFQHTIDDELKPCGRLFPARWRISSMANHDFLLATSVICYYLQLIGNKIDPKELHNLKKIMKRTQTIWVRGSNLSMEGKKAAEAVNAALPGILEYDEDEAQEQPPVPTMPELRPENIPGPIYQDYPAGFQMPFSLFGTVFQDPLIISADFNNPGTLSSSSAFVDPWLHAYPDAWDGAP